MSNFEDIKERLRKARRSRPASVEAEEQPVRQRISDLVANGEITQDEVTRGVLRAQLKIFGERVAVPGVGLRSRMRDWTPGLYTDEDVSAFDYIGGNVDRAKYEDLIRDVKETHAPKLLRDLVRQDQLDLAARDMEGVVAEAWSLGEPNTSGVDPAAWVSLFERNGFVSIGRRRIDPPIRSIYFAVRLKIRNVGWLGVPRSMSPAGSRMTASVVGLWAKSMRRVSRPSCCWRTSTRVTTRMSG